MFKTQQLLENDLPTSSQLLRSTIIAILVASVLLLLVVLPAEYGVDPTGVGQLIGLKKMGEIKTGLTQDALKETQSMENELSVKIKIDEEISVSINENQDVMEFAISPGQAIEIKLEMKQGSVVQYKWTTNNGSLNYDLHGDGYKGSQKFISYKKGRMSQSDKGELKAEFDGYHGWFWRNRENIIVTGKLETTGDYIQIKQIL